MSYIAIQNRTGQSLSFQGKIYANNSFVNMSKIITYKVGYKKLWSSDTGRAMTGENKGTLVGIFPKLTLKVGSLTEKDAQTLELLTMVANTQVRYYESASGKTVTNMFYFGDVDDEITKFSTMRHKSIEISIIATKKR